MGSGVANRERCLRSYAASGAPASSPADAGGVRAAAPRGRQRDAAGISRRDAGAPKCPPPLVAFLPPHPMRALALLLALLALNADAAPRRRASAHPGTRPSESTPA